MISQKKKSIVNKIFKITVTEKLIPKTTIKMDIHHNSKPQANSDGSKGMTLIRKERKGGGRKTTRKKQ